MVGDLLSVPISEDSVTITADEFFEAVPLHFLLSNTDEIIMRLLEDEHSVDQMRIVLSVVIPIARRNSQYWHDYEQHYEALVNSFPQLKIEGEDSPLNNTERNFSPVFTHSSTLSPHLLQSDLHNSLTLNNASTSILDSDTDSFNSEDKELQEALRLSLMDQETVNNNTDSTFTQSEDTSRPTINIEKDMRSALNSTHKFLSSSSSGLPDHQFIATYSITAFFGQDSSSFNTQNSTESQLNKQNHPIHPTSDKTECSTSMSAMEKQLEESISPFFEKINKIHSILKDSLIHLTTINDISHESNSNMNYSLTSNPEINSFQTSTSSISSSVLPSSSDSQHNSSLHSSSSKSSSSEISQHSTNTIDIPSFTDEELDTFINLIIECEENNFSELTLRSFTSFLFLVQTTNTKLHTDELVCRTRISGSYDIQSLKLSKQGVTLFSSLFSAPKLLNLISSFSNFKCKGKNVHIIKEMISILIEFISSIMNTDNSIDKHSLNSESTQAIDGLQFYPFSKYFSSLDYLLLGDSITQYFSFLESLLCAFFNAISLNEPQNVPYTYITYLSEINIISVVQRGIIFLFSSFASFFNHRSLTPIDLYCPPIIDQQSLEDLFTTTFGYFTFQQHFDIIQILFHQIIVSIVNAYTHILYYGNENSSITTIKAPNNPNSSVLFLNENQTEQSPPTSINTAQKYSSLLPNLAQMIHNVIYSCPSNQFMDYIISLTLKKLYEFSSSVPLVSLNFSTPDTSNSNTSDLQRKELSNIRTLREEVVRELLNDIASSFPLCRLPSSNSENIFSSFPKKLQTDEQLVNYLHSISSLLKNFIIKSNCVWNYFYRHDCQDGKYYLVKTSMSFLGWDALINMIFNWPIFHSLRILRMAMCSYLLLKISVAQH